MGSSPQRLLHPSQHLPRPPEPLVPQKAPCSPCDLLHSHGSTSSRCCTLSPPQSYQPGEGDQCGAHHPSWLQPWHQPVKHARTVNIDQQIKGLWVLTIAVCQTVTHSACSAALSRVSAGAPATRDSTLAQITSQSFLSSTSMGLTTLMAILHSEKEKEVMVEREKWDVSEEWVRGRGRKRCRKRVMKCMFFVHQPKSATRLGTYCTPCAHSLDHSHEAELLASHSAFTAPGPF